MERKEAIRREGVIDRVKETSPHTPDGVECPWVKEIFVRLKLSRLRLVLRFGRLPSRPTAGFVFWFKKAPPPRANDKLQDVTKAEAAGVICLNDFDFITACMDTY